MSKPSENIRARDLLGTHVVDYDEVVDVKRLREERLNRLQTQIHNHDLGGLILFNPLNVRYAIGVRANEMFSLLFKIGYHVLVPREGTPILFRSTGFEPPVIEGTIETRRMHTFEFWEAGDFTYAATLKWAKAIKEALKDKGIAKERIGMDAVDPSTLHALEQQGIRITDALKPMALSRAVKTIDEIALIRQACAVADVACWEVKQALKPGITENELFAVLSHANLKNNGERIDCKLLAAGGNTFNWVKRTATSRMIRPGDLLTFDTDLAGPLGYFGDQSRSYLCGNGKPNAEQLEAYKLAYDWLNKSIPVFQKGATFHEIAQNVPPVPDRYKTNRYPVLAHGAGMCDEWPAIYFPDVSDTGFGNYPGQLEENMVICVESSFGCDGGREQVKLEEQLLITANGPEVLTRGPYDWRFLD